MTNMQDSPRRLKSPRHRFTTRLWHWVNDVALIILFMSGLNIFNAHPKLYWGKYGFDGADAWLILDRFPHWMTIPGYYSLADARLWHLFFAWVLAAALTVFMITSLLNRHIQRDLHVEKKQWKFSVIWADIKQHMRFDFHAGAGRYNLLQKFSYILVIFVMIPLMIFTGITMSTAMAANWPWLLDIFGGRQSARSIHFIVTWSLVVFFVVHILLVMLSGPVRQIRGMITGGETAGEKES